MSIHLRLLNPEEDFTALVELLTDIENADHAGDDTSAEALRARFNWRGHDPSRDRWVAVDEQGHLIGHAWLFRQSPQRSIVSAAVHPNWRKHSLGGRLLAETIQRAREYEAVEIVSGTEATSPDANTFLQHRGFKPAGNARRLTAPKDTPLDEPSFPEGFTLLNLAETGDLDLLAAACNRCYQDMWGHRENTEPATAAHLIENMQRFPHHYFPEGIFILLAPDGKPAGVCFSRLAPDNTHDQGRRDRIIDSPGVAPAYRRLDLQRPLMQASMRWLAGKADGEYILETWGDSDEAMEIYRELGFTMQPRDHFIEYLLVGGDPKLD